MTQYAILTDLNRCVGCLSCTAACKAVNEVPVGNYWNKVLRIGPNPKFEGAQIPDIDMYFLPVQCQHCENPACVEVCPTSASHKLDDGTVQIDKSKCIGCQFCAMACPYGVRYLNEEERVVEKCTLCEQQVSQGELPQCVSQCCARARYFGDVEKGLDSFEGPGDYNVTGTENVGYQDMKTSRARAVDYLQPFGEEDIYHLPDVGNSPSMFFILRNMEWRG